MSLQFPSQLQPGQCVLVPVDVKQNRNHPPSVHCAPIAAAEVLDDRALICRGTFRDSNEGLHDRLTVQFLSELGGPFGAGVSENYQHWHTVPAGSFMEIFKPIGLLLAKLQAPDGFSRYTFETTAEGQLALTTTTDTSTHYAVDDQECARRAVAGAFACWGYGIENDALIDFAKQFYTAATSTAGVALPDQDRIAVQKGTTLPLRIGVADAPQGRAITLAADVAKQPAQIPAMRSVFNDKLLASQESIPLDVKANDVMPFNINFAPINASVVTNDVAMLNYAAENSELCVRFQSEVGGPLGDHKEGFSSYSLCMDGSNMVYEKKKDGSKFKADSVERAVFAIASAVGVYAYQTNNFNLKHYADQLYANRAQLTTAGVALPSKDQLAHQTKTYAEYDRVEAMLQQSEYIQGQYKKSFWDGFLAGAAATYPD